MNNPFNETVGVIWNTLEGNINKKYCDTTLSLFVYKLTMVFYSPYCFHCRGRLNYE